MKVVVFYQSGKLDVFTSSDFACNEPWVKQGINVMTEFCLRLDLLEAEGLVVDVFWYDSSDSSEGVESVDADTSAVIKHAMRRTGRRIRLVSLDELAEIAQITIDDELAVWRQGEYLINGIKFKNQEILCFSNDNITGINRRASAVFEYLKNANPKLEPDKISAMMGYPLKAIEELQEAETANIESNDNSGEE